MRIIALLAWYDEPASWLAELVASLGSWGIDHLIAADGAYYLYPEGRAASAVDQQEVILRTAVGVGMGCTLIVPQAPWDGNEVEKRSALFASAEAVADTEEDWYFVIDADMVLTDAPGLKASLARLNRPCVNVTLWERHADGSVYECPNVQLVRAFPGLRCVSNHYTYATADRVLRGDGAEFPAALPEIRVEHRQHQRVRVRALKQGGYYSLRDDTKAERSHVQA